MSDNTLKNPNTAAKYISAVRQVLTIALFACTTICLAFRKIQWDSEAILSFFSNLTSLCDILKRIFLVCLLCLETGDLTRRFITERKTSLRDIAVFVAFLVAAVLLHLFSGYDHFVLYAFLLYFSRYVDFKTLVLTYVIVYTVSLLALVYGNLSGCLPLQVYGRGYSFGLSHSNSAGLFLVTYIWAVGYFLKKRKIILTVLCVLADVLLYVYMQSRTPFICCTLFLILLWLEKPYEALPGKVKKTVNVCFILLPLLLTAASFLLGWLLARGMISMDKNCSSRFLECYLFATEEGFSLGFRDIPLTVAPYGINSRIYYFDNTYARLMFQYGLVTYLLAAIGGILANASIVKHRDYYMLVLCTCLYVYSTMEYLFYFNLFPLLLMAYMVKHKDIAGVPAVGG